MCANAKQRRLHRCNAFSLFCLSVVVRVVTAMHGQVLEQLLSIPQLARV